MRGKLQRAKEAHVACGPLRFCDCHEAIDGLVASKILRRREETVKASCSVWECPRHRARQRRLRRAHESKSAGPVRRALRLCAAARPAHATLAVLRSSLICRARRCWCEGRKEDEEGSRGDKRSKRRPPWSLLRHACCNITCRRRLLFLPVTLSMRCERERERDPSGSSLTVYRRLFPSPSRISADGFLPRIVFG